MCVFNADVCVFIRAEPKKKKKVDPKREQAVRDRLRKKLKKLEKVPPELIPIEDFITSSHCLDETRYSSFHTLQVTMLDFFVNTSSVVGVLSYLKSKNQAKYCLCDLHRLSTVLHWEVFSFWSFHSFFLTARKTYKHANHS